MLRFSFFAYILVVCGYILMNQLVSFVVEEKAPIVHHSLFLSKYDEQKDNLSEAVNASLMWNMTPEMLTMDVTKLKSELGASKLILYQESNGAFSEMSVDDMTNTIQEYMGSDRPVQLMLFWSGETDEVMMYGKKVEMPRNASATMKRSFKEKFVPMMKGQSAGVASENQQLRF